MTDGESSSWDTASTMDMSAGRKRSRKSKRRRDDEYEND